MDQQSRHPVSADDLAVTLAVRQDLGPTADAAVIAEFLDRVGPAIDARVEQRLAAVPAAPSGRGAGASLALAMASMGMGIPISAIALNAGDGAGGVLALGVAWAGIVGVNWGFGRG